ncbi:ATP synthase F0 subunit C [Candidatus Babeliales bacterium]|nr:ATP synthase F0 subunit C [Candidatus Babeliales bacterium]
MDANVNVYAQAAIFVGAAIAMSIGTIGPSIAQGLIGAKACENVGKYSESYSKIRTTMIISMALVESCAIYVLITSMLIIFRAA